jgi:hypothetical protein
MIPQDLQDLKDVREVIRLAMEQLGPDAGIEDLRRAYDMVYGEVLPLPEGVTFEAVSDGEVRGVWSETPDAVRERVVLYFASAFHGPLVVGGRARASSTMPKRPSRSGVAPVCQTGR